MFVSLGLVSYEYCRLGTEGSLFAALLLLHSLLVTLETGCSLTLMQPNKVYIGGLPEYTRKEDLQNCFGKIGNIVNIELK